MAVRLDGWLLAATLVVLLVHGCSSGGPERFAVSGRVTFDGVPLSDGEILLRPDSTTKGPTVAGHIENGVYDIPAGRGPVAGGYTISISAERPTGRKVRADIIGEATTEQYEQYLPPEYNSRTTLRVEIANDHDDLNFQLKSQK